MRFEKRDDMKIKFGEVTCGEIEVMLDAAQSELLAKTILMKHNACGAREFDLTLEEAIYLRNNLWGDAGRVAEACGEAVGRAFIQAGNKLNTLIEANSKSSK
jgi:hypothetical protein